MKLTLTKPLNRTVTALLFAAAAALIPLRAADVASYGMGKGQAFSQNSSADPAPASGSSFFFYAFANAQEAGTIQFVFLQTPNGGFKFLTPNSDGSAVTLQENFASQAALDGAFPNGEYMFTITTDNDNTTPVTLALTDGPLPLEAPHISNYAATQSIDPGGAFTLTWDPLADGAAADLLQLVIEDSTGSMVFSTGGTGQPGALNGTATSAVIPGGTLSAGETYTARLLFQKIITQDTAGYPGALGLTTTAKETSLLIKAAGASTDNTPPALISSSPVNNATGILVDTEVLFTFSEAMGAGSAIAWSANITPANFNCSWSVDKRTFTCRYQGNLPANAVVTWVLNPPGTGATGFTDLAGNPLPENVFNGRFTTTCQSNQAGASSFFLSKSISYVQSPNSQPTLQSPDPASFLANVAAPSGRPLSTVTLRLPNGNTQNLSNIFGSSFFAIDSFNTIEALEARYPSGTYTLTMNEQGGASHVGTLNLPSSSFPPIPTINNLTAGQSINPDANFTLRWDPFSGATAQNGIFLTITEEGNGVVFVAPEPCIPRILNPTDTSIVIPAGTFKSGKTYNATLSFSTFTDQDNSGFPGTPGSASLSKDTTFILRTTGQTQQPPAPRFTLLSLRPTGAAHLRLEGQAGVNYQIEGSFDLITWVPVTTTGGAAIFDFDDNEASFSNQRFYRARSL